MLALDMAFFEEYKRLEKLCGDMFSSRQGVSDYLSRMEALRSEGLFCVPSWDADYRLLKHIRWVRNRLAHDDVSAQISEQADLAFVKDFYGRILSGRDPLAQLSRIRQQKSRKPKQGTISYTAPHTAASVVQPPFPRGEYGQYPKEERARKKRRPKALRVLLIVLLILLLYVFYRYPLFP